MTTIKRGGLSAGLAGVVAALALTMAALCLPVAAHADNIASGTWGTCPWEISGDGTLIIGAGTGVRADSGISMPWSEHREEIKSVTTSGTVVLPANCYGLFSGLANLESANLSGFDTSNVTNMHQMFSNCTSLASLNMAGWNTSNVTDMEIMFWGCSSLESLDVTGFDTSNVEDMLSMFAYCSSLRTIDLSHFSTVSATKMGRMFEGCESLVELDLSTFDTSKAGSMRRTFSACFALEKVTLGEKFSFSGSNDTVSAILPGTSWHSQKDDAWYAPEEISSGRSNVADVYTRPAGQDIARGTWGTCKWAIDSSFVLTIGEGTGATSSGYDFATGDSGYWAYTSRIKAVKTSGKVVLPADSSHLFEFCYGLESADLSDFDTSEVKDMSGMFKQCGSLRNLDLSFFNTSNVTDMNGMFQCTLSESSLQSLDISSFDTSKVEDMEHMFTGCTALRTIHVGEKWSTKSVTSSGSMFLSCESLVGGNGTKFDASHIDAEYARADMAGSPGYLALKTTSGSNPIPISGATVTVSTASYVYDGSAKTPAVTVTLDGAVLPASAYDVAYADNVEVGIATVTVTGKGNYTGTAKATFSIAAAPEPEPEKQAMHRLYNPNSGEHFYTADDAERDGLVELGWNSEGDGWTAPEVSNTPVYRMYNPVAGEHHYTPDVEERDMLVEAGWNDEGIGWYSDDAQTVPLYRDYNPNAFANNHNYTVDKAEHEWLLFLGWRDEGYAWYGM